MSHSNTDRWNQPGCTEPALSFLKFRVWGRSGTKVLTGHNPFTSLDIRNLTRAFRNLQCGNGISFMSHSNTDRWNQGTGRGNPSSSLNVRSLTRAFRNSDCGNGISFMSESNTKHLLQSFPHAGAVVPSDEPVPVRPFLRHVSRAPADLYEGLKEGFEILRSRVVCKPSAGCP